MIVNPHLKGSTFFWKAGPVGVLLVHGFTATTAEVRPLAKTLYDEGYTVSAPLLPGHFKTPQELNKIHWRDWVQEVERAYLDLTAKCVCVAAGGESMGGLLSLYLAAKHPEIAALLLYAPALRLNYSSFDILKLKLAAPFVESVPKPHPDSNPLWQGYGVNPLNGVQQLLKLQRFVKPLLPKISQPTLIVQGVNDLTVHPNVPMMIKQSIRSKIIETHWMKASTHCVVIDREMDEVAKITIQFLEKTI